MSEDEDDAVMSLEEAVASAQDIVDQLRARWKDSGLPVEVLAHAMIGTGITDLTNERGVQATLDVLRELVGEIEEAARGRPN